MNINRHNYEEFFILYMDNELNAAEKQMVEAFVQNNPDLKDELDILLQSRLTPDNTILFEGKEELMKIGEGSFINLTNYEEWLILYVDNELNQGQKTQVERFVASHSQLQNELSILQKAKLQPEEIVFPHKESLYRSTEKVRVVQMKWWRVAAAAILLLAIGTTVVLVINKKKQPEGIVQTPSNNEIKSNTNNTTKIKTDSEIKNEANQDEIKKNNESNKAEESKLANNEVRKENKSTDKKIEKKKDEQPMIANNSPSNNLPEPLDNPNMKGTEINPDIATNKINSIGITPPQTNNTLVTKELQKTSNEGLTFVKDDPKNDLEEGQNKSSRGFFRKAVRFFEKTTGIKPANDDDKVLIGGLAVKLK